MPDRPEQRQPTFPVDTGPEVDLVAENARLTAEVKRLEALLRDTREAAAENGVRLVVAQRRDSLGLLAGGIAHDFNNLLSAILGYAGVAEAELSEDDPVRGYVTGIMQSAEVAANLTRQLLAYAGRSTYDISPLDLSELIRAMGPLVRTSLPKGARIAWDLQRDLPLVLADTAQVQQLVLNLVINAGEAMGEGAGELQLRTYRREMDDRALSAVRIHRTASPGSFVVVEVRDSGAGMSAEVLDRVFEPFYTTKPKGHGLGLAAVIGVVEAHRGFLDLWSRPGAGSIFRIGLPKTDIATGHRAEAPPPVPPGEGLVLIIDDEAEVRRVFQLSLEKHGYSVAVAEGGRQGLDLLGILGERVTLVLLDMTMPDMSGEATFSEVRRLAPDVPVLLCSGYARDDLESRLGADAPSGWIQKPVRPVDLARRVGETLRAHRGRVVKPGEDR